MNRRAFFRTLTHATPTAARDLQQVEAEATGMDRRSFLRLLGASTAVTTALVVAGVDVDRLLWIPEKTIVLPPQGGWPATLAKPSDRQVREQLKRSLQPLRSLNAMTLETLRSIAAIRERNGLTATLVDDSLGFHHGDHVQVRQEVSHPGALDWFAPITQTVKAVLLEGASVVATELPFREGLPAEACHAMGAALEHYIRKGGMNVFATPNLPKSVGAACVVKDPKSGLALRGMREFDIASNQYLLRFDVLGGRA